MKSKQEVIQEAWENTNIPSNVWSDYSNTGWVKIKSEQWSSFYHLLDIIKWNDHTWSIRPKSLAGIETNNGWTRIDSEQDLPKENMVFMECVTKLGYQATHHFMVGDEKYMMEKYTHYKLMPFNPPIY